MGRLARLLTIAGLGFAIATAPAIAGERADVISPIDVSVLAPPQPALGTDGKRHMVYELQVHNWELTKDATIEQVQVRTGGSHALLASYSGAALSSLLVQEPFAAPLSTTLVPGEGTILWMDVTLPARGPTPSSLVHRFRVNGIEFPAGITKVITAKPIAIEPPLRGSDLVDANGCCGATPHTRAIQTFDGIRWNAQRYAIDWVQKDASGAIFSGSPLLNTSYFLFSRPVYAVANGVVTSVLGDRPENTPPIPDQTLTNYNAGELVTGNHVILKIAPGVYALYAHLRPGSIRVRLGQKVKAGTVLALSGNSGNSTGPHLHFQLMSANKPLVSNGIPYVFKSFTLEGRLTDPLEQFYENNKGTFSTERSHRTDELPMTGDVVSFGP
jgi:hypothetical protein